tara:strand:+ start:924 stop:1115 length:192 start_codon:yes stop_codon:yes gene_type:complete
MSELNKIDAKLYDMLFRIDRIEQTILNIENSIKTHTEYCKEVDIELNIKLQDLQNRSYFKLFK